MGERQHDGAQKLDSPERGLTRMQIQEARVFKRRLSISQPAASSLRTARQEPAKLRNPISSPAVFFLDLLDGAREQVVSRSVEDQRSGFISWRLSSTGAAFQARPSSSAIR
jgi:hypothetical protein